MIIKEIIENLKQYPENMNVKIMAEYDGGCCSICEEIKFIGHNDEENLIVLSSFNFK